MHRSSRLFRSTGHVRAARRRRGTPWYLRPPWRTLILLGALLGLPLGAYAVWSPGRAAEPGAFARGDDAIWWQHSWLADDAWCSANDREARCAEVRDPDRIETELRWCAELGIQTVYPHLAPAVGGVLPGVDDDQVRRLLEAADRHGVAVVPWIGGVWQRDIFPEDPLWTRRFVASVTALLETHSGLAGVHLNVEPLPSGDDDFIALLEALREALPPDAILSVAAYPPAPFGRDDTMVFWDLDYLARVAEPADQLAFMLYDTGYPLQKVYTAAVRRWTIDLLSAPLDARVLLGVPAYDDAGVPWHDPRVENVASALAGIRSGLATFEHAPATYQGIAVYSEWELDVPERSALREWSGR